MRPAVQDSVNYKAGIFVSVTVILKPCLEIFWCYAPLLPFITSEPQVMLETLMGKSVNRQECEAAGPPLKISKVSVLETVYHVPTSQIDVGFAAAATLSRALKLKKVSQLHCSLWNTGMCVQ